MAKSAPGKTRTSGRARGTGPIAAHQAEARRRTVILLVVCIAAAAALLAYPGYLFIADAKLSSTPRDQIGVPASAAGCLPVEESPARGTQEHVPDGTVVQYDRLPPDSGPHYNQWAPFATKFYTMKDRPAVENLVHNLEHGYVVLWYRDTLDAKQVKELKQVAKTFNGNDPDDKFIAAPWSPTSDGGDFPEGANVILTRWYANPQNPTDATAQRGIRLACASVSGEVIAKFRTDYPVAAAPEPNGG